MSNERLSPQMNYGIIIVRMPGSDCPTSIDFDRLLQLVHSDEGKNLYKDMYDEVVQKVQEIQDIIDAEGKEARSIAQKAAELIDLENIALVPAIPTITGYEFGNDGYCYATLSDDTRMCIAQIHIHDPLVYTSPDYLRSQRASTLMQELSKKHSIPMNALKAMRVILNANPAKDNGVDVVFSNVLSIIEYGASFNSLEHAIRSLGYKKFSCLVVDYGIQGAIEAGFKLENICTIFEHMSVKNCEKLTSFDFKEIYPYLVRCELEQLNAFVAELPKDYKQDSTSLSRLAKKYGCEVGHRTKRALHEDKKIAVGPDDATQEEPATEENEQDILAYPIIAPASDTAQPTTTVEEAPNTTAPDETLEMPLLDLSLDLSDLGLE